MKKNIKRLLAFCLVNIMIFATSTISVGAVMHDEELRGTALLNSYGLVTHLYQTTNVNACDIADAYLDNAGRMVIKSAATTGNTYVAADLDTEMGKYTSYTVEAKLMGAPVANNWHYGIGWNNSRDGLMKNSYTMRAGAYGTSSHGQLICNTVTNSLNGTYKIGQPDTDFADMSAENNVENVFKVVVTKGASSSTVDFYMNDKFVMTKTETSDYKLLDFNIIIPYTQTVAICYMKVLDGSGNEVYYEDFSSEYANRSAIAEYGLTVNTYGIAKSRAGVRNAYVNYDDELILSASGTVQNAYFTLPIPDSAKTLTNYTLEAKIKGISVADGWHYGISWNTQTSGRGYFTMRSGTYTSGKTFGQLLCYPKTGGNIDNYMGNQIDGSAALGVLNTFKVVVSSQGTVSFYMNGILVATVNSVETALSNFSIVVPNGQTIAVDEVAVYDGSNNVVYSEDFKEDASYVGTSVRIDEYSGIRVKSSISTNLTNATIEQDGFKVVEYGTLVAKAENYKTTAMTVGATGVQKAIAYNATTDTYFERNEDETIYTVVLHNIADKNQEYAFRAYYVVEYANGTTETFYQTYNGSYNLVKSLYGVAEQIKADSNATADELAYANTILGN